MTNLSNTTGKPLLVSTARRLFPSVEVRVPRTTIFNVYEMDMDYSGWFVKYRVDLDALMNAFPESINRYLVRREDNEDSFLSSIDIEYAGNETSLKYNGKFDAFEFFKSLSCV
ncbi:hypothetical protein LguiB_013371 [Lonicera macranthoides]